MARQSLRQPYPLDLYTVSLMVVLVAIVLLYIFIGEMMPGRVLHAPELALDKVIPLRPRWALVYGSIYLFLILLPILVVRQPDQIRRTLLAYLMVWVTSYVCFFAYPTVAPRPINIVGSGFAVWGLRFLYGADPPFNCFPSLHVAHSAVSALTSYRVHRGVGVIAAACTVLVGISTLFTKQHYVLDVVAGIFLACGACLVTFRGHSRDALPELDRRAAPALAASIIGILALVAACFWAAYKMGWDT